MAGRSIGRGSHSTSSFNVATNLPTIDNDIHSHLLMSMCIAVQPSVRGVIHRPRGGPRGGVHAGARFWRLVGYASLARLTHPTKFAFDDLFVCSVCFICEWVFRGSSTPRPSYRAWLSGRL